MRMTNRHFLRSLQAAWFHPTRGGPVQAPDSTLGRIKRDATKSPFCHNHVLFPPEITGLG